jgi:hypothetical protein
MVEDEPPDSNSAPEQRIAFLPYANPKIVLAGFAIVSILNVPIGLVIATRRGLANLPLVLTVSPGYLYIEVAGMAVTGDATLWVLGITTWLVFGLGLAYSRLRVGLVISLVSLVLMVLSQIYVLQLLLD